MEKSGNKLSCMLTDPHIAPELNKSMRLSWLAANASIQTPLQQWQRLYSNSILSMMIIKMETTQTTFAMCGSYSHNLIKGVSE
jgi:hypothetical protein